jgi:NADPH-dependent ferric siderophore reductase
MARDPMWHIDGRNNPVAACRLSTRQRIRRHLFEDGGLPRVHAWVRGYWKHGRSGDANDDA